MNPQDETLEGLINQCRAAIRGSDQEEAGRLLARMERLLLEESLALAELEQRKAAFDRNEAQMADLRKQAEQVTRGAAKGFGAAPLQPREACHLPVYFATNRKPEFGLSLAIPSEIDKTPILDFSGDRFPSLTWGMAEVLIPVEHREGEVGSSLLWEISLGALDDRISIERITGLGKEGFVGDLRQRLKTEALVFIHGYNVSFRDGMIRAAQIGFDLDVKGPILHYSWPSKGQTKYYVADEASIEASEAGIVEFLTTVWEVCKGSRITVIAHSMGNRGLMRALQRLGGTLGPDKPFNQIFLAAPDIDKDLFDSLAELYPEFCGSTTIYAASSDVALWASKMLHTEPRVGLFDPVSTSDIFDPVYKSDIIDLVKVAREGLDDFGLHHSYFAEKPMVLEDISRTLGRRIEKPLGARTAEGTRGGVWELSHLT